MPPASWPPKRWSARSRPTADYAALIREHGAEKVRFVATSASRDARNRQVFVDGIRDLLGVEPEVITGDEEAALSFAGASSVLPIRGGDQVLVVDLGGGSTEFVLGDASGVTAARSRGHRLRPAHRTPPAQDPPTAEQIAAAEADVDAAIDRGGTGRSAGTRHRRRRGCRLHHHHHRPRPAPAGILPRRRSTAAELSIGDRPARPRPICWQMTRAERAALPYMHPGRVDVIGAGALVWRRDPGARWASSPAAAIVTATASEHDILDGIALSSADALRVTDASRVMGPE